MEDDQEIRNLLVDSLSHIGYDGVEASDGEAGSQCALEEHPDIILLGATLPIMDGFEVLQKLKSNPTTSTALIIMLAQGPRAGHQYPIGCRSVGLHYETLGAGGLGSSGYGLLGKAGKSA